MRKSSFYFLIILLLSFSITSITLSQSSDEITAPGDTVFVEIILDENGVVAQDSSGNEWYYDFDEEYFVQGEKSTRDTEGRREGHQTDDVLPIDERCTELIKIKHFVKSVTVGYDEYVDGDILATGRVRVKGWVKGDITSYQGRVTVSESAQVDGDIEAPEIIIKEGGIVKGRQIISSSPLDIENLDLDISVNGIIIVLSIAAFIIMMNFIILSLMPRQQENINLCIDQNKIKVPLIGFLSLFLLPVFIAITIVGLILLPLLPFLYLFAMVMGMSFFGNKIGRFVSMKLFKKEKSSYFQTFIGLSMLLLIWFATSILLSLGKQPAYGFGIFFLVVSIVVTSYPICAGMGAALLTRFGFKRYTSWKEKKLTEKATLAPAPPPIPKSPDNFNSGSSSSPQHPPPPQSPTPPDNL